MILNSQK